MKLTPEQLEWIVSEVVKRLLAASSDTRPSASCDTSGANPLRIEERLVTLDLLKGRLNGVKCVEIQPRTIVTPAVVDELKKRGVRLVRLQGAPS